MGKLGAGKRFHRVLFFSYLLLVIYLMLFAFGRTKQWDTYQFSFTLTSIPLDVYKRQGYAKERSQHGQVIPEGVLVRRRNDAAGNSD